MTLPRPALDDRSYSVLVADALRHIQDLGLEKSTWTGRSRSDPGRTLLELFAYITEQLQFRLNQMPEQHYVALLELIGVRLLPPVAAVLDVELRWPKARGAEYVLGPEHELTVGSIRFRPPPDTVIPPGDEPVTVIRTYNADFHPRSRVGFGDSQAGQRLRLPRGYVPVVAPLQELPSFRLWVEAEPGTEGTEIFSGVPFRLFDEVDDFSGARGDDPVYRLDRVEGVVEFAPALRRRLPSGIQLDGAAAGSPTPPFSIVSAEPSRSLLADAVTTTIQWTVEIVANSAEVELKAGTRLDLGDGITVVDTGAGDLVVVDGGRRATATVLIQPGAHSRWRDATLSGTTEGVCTRALRVPVRATISEDQGQPGAIPGRGRAIHVECWSGGGAGGHVGANTVAAEKLLEFLKAEKGVSVVNPGPSRGGRDAETLTNALRRGPQELSELKRVITAADYEAFVLRSSGSVARAYVGAALRRWAHARPGTVEVILVPHIPDSQRGGAGAIAREDLVKHGPPPRVDWPAEGPAADNAPVIAPECARLRDLLDTRRPLGTNLEVWWCQYKTVTVSAQLQLHRGAEPERVRQEVLRGLNELISPLSWPYRRPMLVSDVYEAMLRHPSVNYAEGVELSVQLAGRGESAGGDVPFQTGEVEVVKRDPTRPNVCYAAADEGIFRSLNGGLSWEPVLRVEGLKGRLVETIQDPREAEGREGLVVAVLADGTSDVGVYVSEDSGQHWWLRIRKSFTDVAEGFGPKATALIHRDGHWFLLLGTTKQLKRLPLFDRSMDFHPLTNAGLNVNCIAVADYKGRRSVYVGRAQKVYVSTDGLDAEQFATLVTMPNETALLRSILVEPSAPQGPGARVWLGVEADVGRERPGVYYGNLVNGEVLGEWTPVTDVRNSNDVERGVETVKWKIGSVNAILRVSPDELLLATNQGGVARLEGGSPTFATLSSAASGLSIRGAFGRLFEPMNTLALSDGGKILAGGEAGVFTSVDAEQWDDRSKAGLDVIEMPPGYLPVSGAHRIEIVRSTGTGSTASPTPGPQDPP